MRTFALTHDGIITRVVQAEQNPFHASLRAFEVTGIPAQVGNTVDAVGNVGPSVPMSAGDALAAKRAMLRGESHYRRTLGVILPAGDPQGRAFDVGHGNLAVLAALAAAGSPRSVAADGFLTDTPAKDAYEAAASYLAAVLEHEAALSAALDSDPEADIAAGWPDNGAPKPAEAPPAAPPPPAAAPDVPHGTGIVPEQTVEAPHADPAVTVEGDVAAPVVQP